MSTCPIIGTFNVTFNVIREQKTTCVQMIIALSGDETVGACAGTRRS